MFAQIAYAERCVQAHNGVNMQNMRIMKLKTVIDTMISIVEAYSPMPDIYKELEDYFESLSIEDVYRRII